MFSQAVFISVKNMIGKSSLNTNMLLLVYAIRPLFYLDLCFTGHKVAKVENTDIADILSGM